MNERVHKVRRDVPSLEVDGYILKLCEGPFGKFLRDPSRKVGLRGKYTCDRHEVDTVVDVAVLRRYHLNSKGGHSVKRLQISGQTLIVLIVSKCQLLK